MASPVRKIETWRDPQCRKTSVVFTKEDGSHEEVWILDALDDSNRKAGEEVEWFFKQRREQTHETPLAGGRAAR